MGVGVLVLLQYPSFGQSDTVADPTFVVAHQVKFDRLYLGIANPLLLTVDGVPCEALRVWTSQGTVQGLGCDYTVIPEDQGRLLILYAEWDDNGTNRQVTREFYVHKLRLPNPYFAGRTCEDDSIRIVEARAGRGVLARYDSYEVFSQGGKTIRFKVESYDLELERECSVFFFERSSMAELTGTMRTALEQTQVGDHLRIFNIVVTSLEGGRMELPPLRLAIVE